VKAKRKSFAKAARKALLVFFAGVRSGGKILKKNADKGRSFSLYVYYFFLEPNELKKPQRQKMTPAVMIIIERINVAGTLVLVLNQIPKRKVKIPRSIRLTDL
jgi:hypothetical protein